MLQAGSARSGSLRILRFRQAAAIAGVLFARSYERAQAIHQAMISRGFEGRLPAIRQAPFGLADLCFGVGATAVVISGSGGLPMGMIVEVRDLSFTYEDGTRALKGIDFDLEEGQSSGLNGRERIR